VGWCQLVTKAVTPPPTKAPAAKIAACTGTAVKRNILVSRNGPGMANNSDDATTRDKDYLLTK
jgi:hypothetical protein